MASANAEYDRYEPRLVGDVDQDTKDHDFDLGRSIRQSFRSIQSGDVQALEVSEELVMDNQEETDKKPNTTQQVRYTNQHALYRSTVSSDVGACIMGYTPCTPAEDMCMV